MLHWSGLSHYWNLKSRSDRLQLADRSRDEGWHSRYSCGSPRERRESQKLMFWSWRQSIQLWQPEGKKGESEVDVLVVETVNTAVTARGKEVRVRS